MRSGELNPAILQPLLERLGAGDRPALDDLVALVYRDLHRLAGNLVRGETNGTRPTSLVNDLYLELHRQGAIEAENAEHFFHIAGYLMRQILVARARSRAAAKRGAGCQIVPLDQAPPAACAWDEDPDTLLALDAALHRLESIDPLKSRIVELRYFSDLSIEETARVLHLSPSTVKRHWSVARLWLFDQLQSSES